MRTTLLALALLSLTACSWETYKTADGHTSVRQKYQTGTPVYYEDGTYSQNMRHNQYRPQQRALTPQTGSTETEEVRGTQWWEPVRQ